MKIVINKCYGGFDLSNKAIHYLESQGFGDKDYREPENRTAPELIEVVEALHGEASVQHSKLVVVEIPEGEYQKDWVLQEYDGYEQVTTPYKVLA